MEPGIIYCTAYPEDSSFVALHDAFSYPLSGSCTANPEYDPGDMRKAILHALVSFTDTTTPFLVVTVLPVWEDTPGTPQRYEITTTWKHSSRFQPDTCDLFRATSNQIATRPPSRRLNGQSNRPSSQTRRAETNSSTRNASIKSWPLPSKAPAT